MDKLEEIIDNGFGMFLKDKDNPIYLNIKDETIKAIRKYFKELVKEG